MKNKKLHSEIKLLLVLLDEAYEKKTWHGPNLRGSIRGLSAQQAARRTSPRRHNIWEVVVHAAYWKYIMRRRLLGEKKGSFPLRGSNWFKRPEVLSEKAWKQDIDLLEHMHRALCRAAANLSLADLKKTPGGSKVSNKAMIYGAAFHDVYHAGQIQLLKRMMK